MSDFKYHDKQEIVNAHRLRELKKELPIFMDTYFRGIDTRTTLKTQLAYAYDSRIFFEYLKKANPSLKNISIRNFPLSLLEEITVPDLEEYVEYLKYSGDDDIAINELNIRNKECGLFRKVSSLRSLYDYFYRNQLIKYNPAGIIATPKLREKEIIRLEPDEVAKLLDAVEAGSGSTERQTKYRQLTKCRDLALLTLLLGTGIRVSECVGIDIQHVDFKNGAIRILRKGEKESIIYFGDEVEKALYEYLVERNKITPLPDSENALFLSTRRKRISVRAVEVLVSSYSKLVTPLKKITPHKLRSTYGTSLYQETGDIYLVADVLGHADVNTTKKHYSAQSNLSRRKAAKMVQLREECE